MQKRLAILLILVFSTTAAAAIAYDANAAQLSITTTASFTSGSGSNRLLIVAFTGSNDILTVTYAGVSMARIGSLGSHSPSFADAWGLLAPATGANNIAITTTGGGARAAFAASYSGVSQTGFPDAVVVDSTSSAPSGDTAWPINITTVAANAWIIAIGHMAAGDWGPGGNGTVIAGTSHNAFYHRGPVASAGATTISIDTVFSGGTGIAAVAVSFAPSGAAATKVVHRVTQR